MSGKRKRRKKKTAEIVQFVPNVARYPVGERIRPERLVIEVKSGIETIYRMPIDHADVAIFPALGQRASIADALRLAADALGDGSLIHDAGERVKGDDDGDDCA